MLVHAPLSGAAAERPDHPWLPPAQPLELAENLIYWLADARLIELRDRPFDLPADNPLASYIAECFALRRHPPPAAVRLSGGMARGGRTQALVATVSAPVQSVADPAAMRVLDCPQLLTESRVFSGADADMALLGAVEFLRHWADLRGGYLGPSIFP
jgi:hypothetical protein